MQDLIGISKNLKSDQVTLQTYIMELKNGDGEAGLLMKHLHKIVEDGEDVNDLDGEFLKPNPSSRSEVSN